MIPRFGFTIILTLIFGSFATAQVYVRPLPSPTPGRPRTITPTPTPNNLPPVVVGNAPRPNATPTPKPTVSPTPYATPKPSVTPTPSATAYPTPTPYTSPTAVPIYNGKTISFGQIRNQIAEAKRLMQTRPIQTALIESYDPNEIVRIAAYDSKSNEIQFLTLTKDLFLQKDLQMGLVTVPTKSAAGKNVVLRIIRANGVNTPVAITDADNYPMLPLVVQYPIVRGGSFQETAYYTSTHFGLVTPEVIRAGQIYVRNTIDIARQKLLEKGVLIQPQVADIAERLSTVEHVDHQRFNTEFQQNIYNDIFTLYALNEGTTYRYSVSSAGAGGMVQMIPATYALIRSRYYNVGLIPDFVDGMRNHVNATQAMLLYMQLTWNDLTQSETIYNALADGTATQPELMAAGYNSNPSKLPGYIRRGGANWKAYIPRETKTYLQIYGSLERFVPMQPRTK